MLLSLQQGFQSLVQGLLRLSCSCLAGLDGGGSIRVPAAMCGVVGVRPSVGRSAHTHCPPTAFSIAAWGPLAASVADAAIVYAVMANAGAVQPTILHIFGVLGGHDAKKL